MAEVKKIPAKGQIKERKQEASVPTKKEKVISGKATLKKKTLGQKVLETFLPGDIKDVKSYVWNEILIPAFKRTVDEFISQGTHMMLYPGDTSPRRRDDGIRASYDYGRQYRSRDRGYDRMPPSSWANDFDLERVSFSSRVDAEMVLQSMRDSLREFSFVRVADFYDFAGITTDNYQIYNFGWTSLREAEVRRDMNGEYYIRFPKTMPLD